MRARQAGHLLILLMVGIAVMLIMMTVAAQSWTFQMRREMELEVIFRGEQYIKGLEAFRKSNGNAFPVGDLKILAKKNMTGVRYMRKLYKNPFDPNGQWQYLYLHPGGTGFINPCAVGAGPGFNDPRGGPGRSGGLMRGQNGGASTGFGNPFDTRTIGRRSTDDEDDGGLPGAEASSRLSALDPKTFKSTGIQKMNLPIVGVVSCKMVESIREYKGQTWLSNWAFTPLAQGEFGAVAQAGGSGGVARQFTGGVGNVGDAAYIGKGAKNPTPPVFTNDNPWSRDGKFHDEPPPDGGDQGYDAYGNPVNPDPSRPGGPPNGQGVTPPNGRGSNPPPQNPPPHGTQPPNPPGPPPAGNPPPHAPDPNGTVHDPNQPADGSEDEGDDEDEDDDEGDDEEDPNAPTPDPNHPSTPGAQQASQGIM